MKFNPTGPINIIPALVQVLACRRPGDKLLSGPMFASLGLNELRMLAWGFDKHNFYNVGGFHNATISIEYRGDLTKRRMT